MASLRWLTEAQLEVFLTGLAVTPTVSFAAVPRPGLGGTFFSLKNPSWPPLPSANGSLSGWLLAPDAAGGTAFLLNDLDHDYNPPKPASKTRRTLSLAGPPSFDDGDGDTNTLENAFTPLVIDTNGLWLEITSVANGLAYLNLRHATNLVYEILAKTNLLTAAWQTERAVWPDTNQTVMPFTVPTGQREPLLLWARDWTGVDANTNGLPDWWEWQYFGHYNYSASDQDINGQTFAYDYAHNLSPTVFQFNGIQATNPFVASGSVAVKLDMSGVPYYLAVLVDDTNFANAVWNPYVSSNVTANLGASEGWHEVWLGLRGRGDDPTNAVWHSTWLFLELIAPTLVLTSPTNNPVATPFIQLTGYSPVPLASVRYDLSNAAGMSTNRSGYLNNQSYDSVHRVFATNYFQCYDVPLTNGWNVITLHATDMLGKTATVITNLMLDYATDHTAPALNVVWPTNGTTIAGSSFMVQAQLDDPESVIMATVVDSAGHTNSAAGTPDRDGAAWVNDLPLAAGTNVVRVTATDAAGNRSTTNLVLFKSSVGVTLNPLTGDQLNQAFVAISGTVSETNCEVWVNGVQATVAENGEWQAEGVPVSRSGTAVFEVTVRAASGLSEAVISKVKAGFHRLEASDDNGLASIVWTGAV